MRISKLIQTLKSTQDTWGDLHVVVEISNNPPRKFTVLNKYNAAAEHKREAVVLYLE